MVDVDLQINATVLAVFDRFLTENSDSMEDLFNQMDKDKSGDVTLEELKYGLKDFGLRLTSVSLLRRHKECPGFPQVMETGKVRESQRTGKRSGKSGNGGKGRESQGTGKRSGKSRNGEKVGKVKEWGKRSGKSRNGEKVGKVRGWGKGRESQGMGKRSGKSRNWEKGRESQGIGKKVGKVKESGNVEKGSGKSGNGEMGKKVLESLRGREWGKRPGLESHGI